jgi:alpha-mannosidase
MWYTFLIDQFHDVLPGTCTYLTVDDTRENFKNLKIKCEEIYTEAVRNLLPDHSVVSVNRIRPAYDSLNINSDTEMIVTFNGLTQDRTDVITFKNG